MNVLETFLREQRMDEITAMNDLQNHAVISDNCVMACDVANRDCETAVKFLKVQKGELEL